MNITSELVFQLITLLCTVFSAVWFFANQLASLKSRLGKVESQLSRLEKLEANIEGLGDTCRQGRVTIWETVNEERLKVAELKAKIEK
jgi:hypothetical protein